MKRFLPSLRRLFGLGPKLRNKPGGMAWIKPAASCGNGDEVIVGRAVRTVRVDGGFWTIDPPQRFTVTTRTFYEFHQETVFPGSVLDVLALSDDAIEPWKDVGDDARDESARYLPAVPKTTAPMVKEPA
jgi:hypothetical protein